MVCRGILNARDTNLRPVIRTTRLADSGVEELHPTSKTLYPIYILRGFLWGDMTLMSSAILIHDEQISLTLICKKKMSEQLMTPYFYLNISLMCI